MNGKNAGSNLTLSEHKTIKNKENFYQLNNKAWLAGVNIVLMFQLLPPLKLDLLHTWEIS